MNERLESSRRALAVPAIGERETVRSAARFVACGYERLPYMLEKRHVDNAKQAIEVMNAVIEAYDHADATGQLTNDPGATLVAYITDQMIGDDADDAYRLLSGFTTLMNTLLLHIELTQKVPRQASLDLLWEAIQAQAVPEDGHDVER